MGVTVGIYEEEPTTQGERERERERVQFEFMWSVGAKGRPRVFWGKCICVRTWWEPSPQASLFSVGPPNGNPNMDPISLSLCYTLSLNFLPSNHNFRISILLKFKLGVIKRFGIEKKILKVWNAWYKRCHMTHLEIGTIEYQITVTSKNESSKFNFKNVLFLGIKGKKFKWDNYVLGNFIFSLLSHFYRLLI